MRPLIEFIVDGEKYAARTWEQIPRAGDTVILAGGDVWVEVTRVIWADDSGTPHDPDRQWVQILCKTIDDPTKADL